MTVSERLRCWARIVLLAMAVSILFVHTRAEAQDREFRLLLIGLEEVPDPDVANLVKSELSKLSLSIRIALATASRHEWTNIVADSESGAAEQRYLRDNNADLAVVFSNYVDRNRAASISFRMVGAPLEGNYPAFPTELHETLVSAGASYIPPVLSLYTSQAIASSFRPEALDRRRYRALREYASALETLDQCAPLGGVSLQTVLLGGISVPDQSGCDDLFVLDAAYAYLTMFKEFSDDLSEQELAALLIRISEAWFLQGSRNADPRTFDKSLPFADAAVELRGETGDLLALLSGLLLRHQHQNTHDDLNRVAAITESQLSGQKTPKALYYAASSTIQRARFLRSGRTSDLESSVEASRTAMRLHTLDLGIETHLLLRTQLAVTLYELGTATDNSSLVEESRRSAARTRTTASLAGFGDLAKFLDQKID